jgi:hypothetical protein
MPAQEKPIIFLAFANEETQDKAYLRNLRLEQSAIRDALGDAVSKGWCELVERPHATIDEIREVFREYKDRIAVFHYGGHANSYQLLLNNESKQGTVAAHSVGLIPFLADRKSLKLVFLNGCSTKTLALKLMENNGCCVIGTSNSINDTVARKLALEFYKSLNAGLHIGQSWRDAQNAIYDSYCKANKRDLVWEGMENKNLTGRELWDLYGKNYLEWKLAKKKINTKIEADEGENKIPDKKQKGLPIVLILGLALFLVGIILAFSFPCPTETQYKVIRIILALAGGFLGGAIPGFLHIKSKFVEAGGGLAVLALFFFWNPAKNIMYGDCKPKEQIEVGVYVGKLPTEGVRFTIPQMKAGAVTDRDGRASVEVEFGEMPDSVNFSFANYDTLIKIGRGRIETQNIIDFYLTKPVVKKPNEKKQVVSTTPTVIENTYTIALNGNTNSVSHFVFKGQRYETNRNSLLLKGVGSEMEDLYIHFKNKQKEAHRKGVFLGVTKIYIE